MSNDRHVADSGKLADNLNDTIIDESRDCETFTFTQLDLGLCSSRAYGRNEESLNLEGI